MDAPRPSSLSAAISPGRSFKLRSCRQSSQWAHVSSSPFPPLCPLGEGSPPSAVLWLAPIPRHPSRFPSLPSVSSTTVRRSTIRAGSDAPLLGRNSAGPLASSLRVDVEASQVPGESSCACPAQETPARSVPPGLLGGRILPSDIFRASALAGDPFSRLSDTAYTLAVYASQHGSPRCHARLASGW